MDMLEQVRADARTALFDAMTDVRAGMLGVEGSGQHMQPMTHFLDEDTAELWFITASDTDLVRAVGQGARAHYCVISKDQTLHACLSGTIVQSQDTEKLDALWSPVAAAWFEGGRDDPKVTLLQLTLLDAAVWATTDSMVAQSVEMARATMDAGHKPDIGEHVVVQFGKAA
ncbi:MAG: pyridoxamine 5'-phosphate oxidase family protein [Albidovulum sp.]